MGAYLSHPRIQPLTVMEFLRAMKDFNQTYVCADFVSKSFSMRAIFVQTLHIFLILFRKHSITFTVTEYGKTRTRFFSALGRKPRSKLN